MVWVVAIVSLFGTSAANIDMRSRCDADSVFECGRQVGQQMRGPIYAAVTANLAALSSYLKTHDGATVFEDLLAANQKAYPEVAREFEGMAEGAGVAARDIFIGALYNELHHFATASGFRSPQPKSCTDYHVMDYSGSRVWGHNEDEVPSNLNTTYLLEASVGSFRYVAFVYAPNAAGWAWGFNSHGIAQSVNALSPTNLSIGIGVNFLARDVLNAVSLDDAVARACVDGLASGQHFNLGSIHEKDRQLLVETSPLGCDVRELLPPSNSRAPPTVGYHVNLYTSEAFRGIDRPLPFSQQSSVHRLKRLDSLKEPRDAVKAVKEVLSDTQDSHWPIHRSAKFPDSCLTLNSVVFDASRETVSVWGIDPPNLTQAVFTYDWRYLRGYSTMPVTV